MQLIDNRDIASVMTLFQSTVGMELSLFSLFVTVITSCTAMNETALQHDLMLNYNRNIAPRNGSLPVDVNIYMSLLAIVVFNEVKETLSTNAGFELNWIDKNLIWDSAVYGNVTETVFRQKELWLPDVIVSNSVSGIGELGDDRILLLVTSDGKVTWKPISTVETICKVKTEYFPYDKQKCAVQLVVRAQTSRMMRVRIPENFIRMYSFTENGQWEVTSTSSDLFAVDNLQLMHFRMDLKRRPGFYVKALIMPILIVSVLNCFVLIVPSNSGEKISFSITVFLSYMVLLTFTTDNLPRTSEYDPYIVEYIAIMLGLSFASVIGSVISLIIQPIGGETSGTSNRIREDSLQETDTPVISVADSVRANACTGKEYINSLSKLVHKKPSLAWEDGKDEKDQEIAKGYYSRFQKLDTSRVTKTLHACKMTTKLRKFLRYFDIFAALGIGITTGLVTLLTLNALLGQSD